MRAGAASTMYGSSPTGWATSMPGYQLASGAFVPTCNLQYGNTGEGVALQRVLNKMTWPACIGCHCY